ncbi:hypothetical protein [Streptomyces sp. NPDC054808]
MPTTLQTIDELYEALQANQRRPYGRTRTVTAEELVDAAEQFEEPLPLVRTLLELQEAYTYGSEPRKSPVTFARLLTLFDEQPDVFDRTCATWCSGGSSGWRPPCARCRRYR